MEANQTKKNMGEILSLLRNALHISKYASMRERFANELQWKEEGPVLRKQAYAAWILAKEAIGSQRLELELFLTANKENLSEEDVNNFIAALKVIDKELETAFEQQILEEE